MAMVQTAWQHERVLVLFVACILPLLCWHLHCCTLSVLRGCRLVRMSGGLTTACAPTAVQVLREMCAEAMRHRHNLVTVMQVASAPARWMMCFSQVH